LAEIVIRLMEVPGGPPDLSLLSEAEQARFAGMESETAATFACGRSLLRRMLGARLAIQPESVALVQPGAGRVTLVTSEGNGPFFSVSHTRVSGKAWVAVAVSDASPVGLDIEAPERGLDWKRLAARRMHPQEKETLFNLPAREAQALFFDIWTVKEALVKLRDGKLLPTLAAAMPDDIWRETHRFAATGLTASIVAEGPTERTVEWHLPADGA